MPKRTRASSAPVISLAAYRAEHQAPPTPIIECDPFDVIDAMIDAYFSALKTQLQKLNEQRMKS